jgi:hypothetical protein
LDGAEQAANDLKDTDKDNLYAEEESVESEVDGGNDGALANSAMV